MEPIAIIGLALKFPQDADTQDGLWDVLMSKTCTMTEWPKDRVNIDAFHSTCCKEDCSVCYSYLLSRGYIVLRVFSR